MSDGLESLAAGVAHDFNNLLASVYNSAQFLAAELETQPDVPQAWRAALQTILDGSRRGQALTTRLLTFGQGRPNPQPRSLRAEIVLDSLTHLLRPLLEQGRIVVERQPGGGVPTVLADPALLETALIDLVINAREAMPDGGTLTLATRAGETSAGAPCGVIVIRDTGWGMTPEVLAQAQQPFFTTKTRREGTGLGLAIATRLIRDQGGNLTLDSTPGLGTEVRLELPASEGPASTEAPALPSRSEPQDGLRILIVDDNAQVAQSTARLLAYAGHTTESSTSGSAALEAQAAANARGEPFDLALVDFLLPEFDGLETIRRLRAQQPGLAALLMSGFAKRDTRPDSSLRIVSKPFRLEELLREIRRALNETDQSSAGGSRPDDPAAPAWR